MEKSPAQKPFTDESRRLLIEKHQKALISRLQPAGEEAQVFAAALAGWNDKDGSYLRCLQENCADWGKGETPDEFIARTPFKAVLEACIPDKREREKYRLIAAKSKQFMYSTGYERRSVRSRNCWADRITAEMTMRLIYGYYYFSLFRVPLSGYLRDELDEEKLDLKKSVFSRFQNHVSWLFEDMLIAAELDWDLAHGGPSELHKTIEDIILGDGNTAAVTVPIIRGIIKSDDRALHELLGKLLLAARLQEGLRQAICENMDCGTTAAFDTLFAVIVENDLIRFSSVKRAVATWIGMFNENAAERVSKKTLALMQRCLYNEDERQTLLHSEDAMELLTALWATGFYEVEDALEAVRSLIRTGTRNQLLVCAYYNRFLNDRSFYAQAAEYAVETHRDDLELLAAFLPTYLDDSSTVSTVWWYEDNDNPWGRQPAMPPVCFGGDLEKARLHADILLGFFRQLGKGKKPKEFSPCTFPWYSVSISKQDIAARLLVMAVRIPGSLPQEAAYEMLENASIGPRAMSRLLHVRDSRADRDFAVRAVANRTLRETAAKLLDDVSLGEEDFRLLEPQLRYKDDRLRTLVSGLIARQDDQGFAASVRRLLAAKNEGERFAALDFIRRLKDGNESLGHRSLGWTQFEDAVRAIAKPTEKEKLLMQTIFAFRSAPGESAVSGQDEPPASLDALYDKDKLTHFSPAELHRDTAVADTVRAADKKQLVAIIEAFDQLVISHQNDEYTDIFGENHLLGEKGTHLKAGYLNSAQREAERAIGLLPFPDLWTGFYEEHIKNPVTLVQLYLLALLPKQDSAILAAARQLIGSIAGKTGGKTDEMAEHEKKCARITRAAFGKLCDVRPGEYQYFIPGIYRSLFKDVAEALIQSVCDKAFFKQLMDGICWYLTTSTDREDFWIPAKNSFPEQCRIWQIRAITELAEQNDKIQGIAYKQADRLAPLSDEDFAESFKMWYALAEQAGYAEHDAPNHYDRFNPLNAQDYFRAYRLGLISEDSMYYGIIRIAPFRKSMGAESFYASKDKNVSAVYMRLVDTVVGNELRRGDSPSSCSASVDSIQAVYGADSTLRLVQALGKAPFERAASWSASPTARNHCLSHFIRVSRPAEGDSAEQMRTLIQRLGIGEQKLYELAMYAPAWIPLLSQVLGIRALESGCYYFIAHMRESWNDQRDTALIAKYTPLTSEELDKGAFDLNWFSEVYAELGEEVFDKLYESAKYISDGSRHSRARKFADAALGRVTEKELEAEINRARNKDLLMSYPLIPLAPEGARGEDKQARLLHRYEFLQQFKKESRQFGAQRRQSEGEAMEIALENLSRSAGYTDVNRLNLTMESALIDKVRELFGWQAIGAGGDAAYELRLAADGTGKPALECRKRGSEKLLKSVPAACKKDERAAYMQDVYKRLKEQHSRTRSMLENFMTDKVSIPAGELTALLQNPVVSPLVSALVFVTAEDAGGTAGFLSAAGGGISLTGYDDTAHEVPASTQLRIAHAYDLYRGGHWHEWQKKVFDRQLVQPFKQVFRELYLKLPEELDKDKSLMFAGNQIQPKKAVASLKGRRWIADYECGLQKVFYRENLIAEIYAQADWFSPADIECPAVEYVLFTRRRSGSEKDGPLRIRDIDDIVYSEIMRDVDLAVSVAHAGSVDPETSHSTIEMRRGGSEFTLPLFQLDNVRFEKNFAFITGSRAEYSVHLGTGLVHKTAGGAINIVAVHSQQRGKLFLPFVDEDPKTAEVLSKILLLARDERIKDPYILSQIEQRL